MDKDYSELKAFVTNFLSKEKFLDDKTVPLSTDEIESLAQSKDKVLEERQTIDRLLNDPEAMEILQELQNLEKSTKGKIIKLPRNKKNPVVSGHLAPLIQKPVQRAAATSSHEDQQTGNAVQVEDDRLSGFVQIAEYKNDQYLLSGHLELVEPKRYLKLIIPGQKSIKQFRLAGKRLLFREILSDWIDITEIIYELY